MYQICKICNRTIKSRLYSHVHMQHNLTTKEYYDIFIKQPIDGICKICNGPTKFNRTNYNICCSNSCAAIYRHLISLHNTKIDTFEKQNNCTSISKLRNTYGQGWYKSRLFNTNDFLKTNIDSIVYFLPNDKISIIENYVKLNQHSGKSKQEKLICNYLRQLYIIFNENIKSIIPPKELDIYIPDLKIAIEYNGTWFHSIENGLSKDYHLKKSLLCREKGIRLIHIYEFEDLSIQLSLLKDLILGNDNYPKNDFNKNNLINQIPIPYLIYTSNRNYHIYGAGPLFKE